MKEILIVHNQFFNLSHQVEAFEKIMNVHNDIFISGTSYLEWMDLV